MCSGISGLVVALVVGVAGFACARADVPVHGPSGTRQNLPSVVLMGSRAVAVMNSDSTINHLRYSVSTDSGKTFTSMGLAPNPVPDFTWWADIQVGLDRSTGDVWVAGIVLGVSPDRWGIGIMRGTWIGDSFTWHPGSIARENPRSTNVTFVPEFAFAVNPDDGRLHLHYGMYLDPAGLLVPNQLVYQYSADGAASWSPPVSFTVPAPAGEGYSSPRLAIGPGAELLATWSHYFASGGSDLRWRRSLDGGQTWSLAETAVSLEQTAGGDFTVRNYSLAYNRVAESPDYGTAALAWTESWRLAGFAFPPMTSTVIRSESEPNDSYATGDSFGYSDAAVGQFASTSDVDFWRVLLRNGDQLVWWVDSTSVLLPAQIAVTLITPGGDSVHYGAGRFCYRASEAGIHALMVKPFTTSFTPPASYRIRGIEGPSAPGGARDHRDVAVATLAPGAGAWSAPRFPQIYQAQRYLDLAPTLWFGDDGESYLGWHDFSVPTPGHFSWYRVAKDVLDLSLLPQSVTTVSSAPTHWAHPTGATQAGYWNGADSDGGHSLAVWTDARNGNSDVFAARLATDPFPAACPLPQVALAGETVVFAASAPNPLELSNGSGQVRVTGARDWPNATLTGYQLSAGGSFDLSVAIDVPDSAAPGFNPLTIEILRADGRVARTCVAELRVAVCETLAVVRAAVTHAPGLRQLVFTDLDDDGNKDLVTTAPNVPYSLRVHLGDGYGNFAPPVAFALPGMPVGLATADFNEDGIPDFAIAQGGLVQVRIATSASGYWTGGFLESTLATSDYGTGPLVAEDFNDDGIVDLLAASGAYYRGLGSAGVGDGTFAPPTYPAVGEFMRDFVTGDFDEDGILDIAYVNADFPYQAGIWLGLGAGGVGTGTFAHGQTISFGASPLPSIVKGDFDEDGILDLAIAEPGQGVHVLRGLGAAGTGDGTFATPVLYGGGEPQEMAVEDVTLDGIADLVCVETLGDVLVMAGTGTGTTGDGGFAPVLRRSLPAVTSLVVIDDVRADGVADVWLSGGWTAATAVYEVRGLCPSQLPDDIVVEEPEPGPGPSSVAMEGLPPAWRIGEERTIAWSAGAAVQAVDVEFSRDAGGTWEALAHGESDGSFAWTVTGPPTTLARIRVRDASIPSRFDESEVSFSIAGENVAVAPSRPPATALSRARPNPSREGVRFDLALARPGAVEVEAFDLAGTRVATLARGTFPAGEHSLRWNGHDERGERTRPGVYFVRARAPGLDAVRKVVLVGDD